MEKIKCFYESDKGKDILVVLIVILVGVASFFIGRLSKESSYNSVKIEYGSQEANTTDSLGQNKLNTPKIEQIKSVTERAQNDASGKYFASKKGKKYYSILCSAGKTIKQENRIYFNSASDAEKAGFSLSSSCKQ